MAIVNNNRKRVVFRRVLLATVLGTIIFANLLIGRIVRELGTVTSTFAN